MAMTYRRYLYATIATVVIGMTATGLFNYLVDPYAIQGSEAISGFNAEKTQVADRVRLSKPYEVLDAKPKTLVLGNSRSEIGIDPDSPVWPGDAQPVYNLALPGTSLVAQYRVFQHAITTGTVKSVVVGLDFTDFLIDGDDPKISPKTWIGSAGEMEGRLLVNRDGTENKDYATQRLKDAIASLLTLDATIDSVLTIMGQGERDQEIRTPKGFSPAQQFPALVENEGHYHLFLQADITRSRALAREPDDIYAANVEWSPAFATLDAFVEDCRKRGIRITFFLHPLHGYIREQIEQFGLGDSYVAWKQALATWVSRHNDQVTVWDFGIYSDETMEDVPDRGDHHTQMKYYWEAGHYKSSLGDLMLARMFGGGDDGFGYRLTSASVEAAVTQDRINRQVYINRESELKDYLLSAAKR